MLVVFATPAENPFPIRLDKGQECIHEGMLLLLAGVGERSVERLNQALTRHGAVTRVVEYGGAAAVHAAEIGRCYTVSRLFDHEGIVVGTIPAVPGLATAAAICGRTIFHGEAFLWEKAVGSPLLYTMETAFLHQECRRRQIPFYSIRLATDDGRGEIRSRYERTLTEHRAEAAEILLMFSEISFP